MGRHIRGKKLFSLYCSPHISFAVSLSRQGDGCLRAFSNGGGTRTEWGGVELGQAPKKKRIITIRIVNGLCLTAVGKEEKNTMSFESGWSDGLFSTMRSSDKTRYLYTCANHILVSVISSSFTSVPVPSAIQLSSSFVGNSEACS